MAEKGDEEADPGGSTLQFRLAHILQRDEGRRLRRVSGKARGWLENRTDGEDVELSELAGDIRGDER